MKLIPNSRKDNAGPNPGMPKGILDGYKRIQGAWANWMMRRTATLTRRTWVALLILFVLSTGTYSAYITVCAIISEGGNPISITTIKRPKHATEIGTAGNGPEVSGVEYMRIKKFRLYMDSLKQTPSGKILYDSITSHRPGLMDSVRFIENYYQQLKRE